MSQRDCQKGKNTLDTDTKTEGIRALDDAWTVVHFGFASSSRPYDE